MGFARSGALVLLAVPLALLAAYLVALRRRRARAVRWSSVDLLREAMPRRARWRRHIPTALALAAMGVLAISVARPLVTAKVEVGRTSIILALDVSQSMCASDVEPNRLAAAQAAAVDFVRAQPSGTRIGLVAYAGFAELAVAPTHDRQALVAAIEGLTTSLGTAIGAALLKSLDAIAEINPDVAPVAAGTEDAASGGPEPPPTKADDGHVPDIVVLLSDGRNTRGIEPLDAVPAAVERRVRVYTIGFGTTQPSGMSCTAEQLGGNLNRFRGGGGGGGFDRFGGGGFANALVADQETLQGVAERTGGTFHAAGDAGELQEVFEDLPRQVKRQDREVEVSWLPAALGALLLVAALVASLRFSPYP